VEERAVIPAPDAPDIYQVPLGLHAAGLDAVVCDRLGLVTGPARLDVWADMVRKATSATATVTVGIVGKYVALPDAYLSVVEALRHGAAAHEVALDLRWIPSDELTGLLADAYLEDLDAIVVPGGFGYRGVEGKVEAIRYAREHDLPFLGLCLGLQCAVIEFARSVLGHADANSTEFDTSTTHPVIDLMASQHEVEDMGGTMRLGLYAAKLAEGSRVRALYGSELVYERHRHRWEVNNRYRKDLEAAGMRLSGLSPDDHLVEFIELIDHPFFVATQAHPELRSRPDDPHPLFAGLLAAACERRRLRETAGMVRAQEPS
jgi:CTP synthase